MLLFQQNLQPASTAQLTPGLHVNAQGFFAAAVTTGAVSLSPTRLANSQTFFDFDVGPQKVAVGAWSNQAITSGNWGRIAFNGVGHLASTENTLAAYSSDQGQTWTNRTLPAGAWQGLGNIGTRFVHLGNGNDLSIYSDDNGVTWTAGGVLPAATGWRAINSGNGVLIAVSAALGIVARSTNNGLTWASITMPGTGYEHVRYGGGKWLALRAGLTNSGAVSIDDGLTWTAVVLPSTQHWAASAYGNGKWAVVAGDSGDLQADTSAIAAGADPAALVNYPTAVTARKWTDIDFVNGVFMAIQPYDGTDSATATDPQAAWTMKAMATAADWFAIAAGNDAFVTVGLTLAFGALNVVNSYGVNPLRLRPAALVNTTAFFAATVDAALIVAPGRTDNAQTFFAPSVSRGAVTLTPALLANSQAFFASSVAPGPVALAPSLFSSAQAFFAPTVDRGSVTVAPGIYINTQAFYAPTALRGAVSLLPALLVNANALFAPSVTAGAVAVSPGLFTNSQTFFGHTALAGSLTLQPQLLTNAQAFPSPSVEIIVNQASPPRIESTNTLFAPSVSTGAVTVSPGLFTNSQVFFGHSVSAGSVTLQPQLLTNTQAFSAPSVEVITGLLPSLLVNASAVFAPSVSTGATALSPALFASTSSFFPATLTPGAVLTQPPLVINTSIVFAPAVEAQAPILSPPLLTNAQQFFATAVSAGAVQIIVPRTENANLFFAAQAYLEPTSFAITPARARMLHRIAMLHGLDPANPLTVPQGNGVRAAGDLTQTVSGAGTGTVTISTTAAPIFSGSLDAWIDLLADVHGLNTPLVVTDTTRSAGTWSQSIVSAGGITTVTRQ